MGYLTDADYDDLPEDDGAAFSALETISRARLHEMGRDQDGDIHFEDMLRYMNEVTAIAAEFGMADIVYEENPENYGNEYARFTRKVDGKLAQIRVQRARRNRQNSVLLSTSSREKIQHHLEKLKTELAASDLSEKRKRALLDKIVEFEAELTKPRVNLALAMTLIALGTTAFHDAGETLVSFPAITKAMTEVIGRDKQDEIDHIESLPRYTAPKALQDHRIKPVGFDRAIPQTSTSTALSSDVSFGSARSRGGNFGGGPDDDSPF